MTEALGLSLPILNISFLVNGEDCPVIFPLLWTTEKKSSYWLDFHGFSVNFFEFYQRGKQFQFSSGSVLTLTLWLAKQKNTRCKLYYLMWPYRHRTAIILLVGRLWSSRVKHTEAHAQSVNKVKGCKAFELPDEYTKHVESQWIPHAIFYSILLMHSPWRWMFCSSINSGYTLLYIYLFTQI